MRGEPIPLTPGRVKNTNTVAKVEVGAQNSHRRPRRQISRLHRRDDVTARPYVPRLVHTREQRGYLLRAAVAWTRLPRNDHLAEICRADSDIGRLRTLPGVCRRFDLGW